MLFYLLGLLCNSDHGRGSDIVDFYLPFSLNIDVKKLYESILGNVESFAEQLVRQCWTAEEVELLLDNKTGMHLTTAPMPAPRLRLALDARMKEVCHSAVGAGSPQTGAKWEKFCDSPRKNTVFGANI